MQKCTMILVSLVLLSCNPTFADTKPSRSECIIGFNLDWSDVRADRRDIANSIAEVNRTQRIDTLAALRFAPHQSVLYLMFKNDCEKKEEMASAQIEIWRENGLDLPAFEQINDPIIPSPRTIDVTGPHWRDGQRDIMPLLNRKPRAQDLQEL